MDPHRAQRISEALREELAEIIEYELSDPRLGGVTVTGVNVMPDLRHAHISIAGGKDPAQALAALEHASGYVRRELAGRLTLFRIPELHFEVASPDAPANRVERLLDRVRKNRGRSPAAPGPDEKTQKTPPE